MPDAARPDAARPDGSTPPDGAVPFDAGPDAQPPPGIDPDSPGLELYYRFDTVLPSGYEIDNLAGPGYDLFFHLAGANALPLPPGPP